jgi:3-oxoacyl-[acyl-carrier-protein] synthase II
MEKKAVITGMGVVSPAGIGKEENWESLLQGKSGIDRFSRLNPDHLPVCVGAEVKNFNPKKFIKDRKAVRRSFFNVHLALAAAELAVKDSGLDIEKVDSTRFGAIVGSGGGGFDDGPGFEDLNEPILKAWDEKNQRFDSSKFGEKGVPVAYPLFLLKALPNNAFYYISLFYNIQGENDNIVSSYTGGAQAIGDAFRTIRRGLADVIIAGGYDSLITPNTVFSLDSFNLLSKNNNPQEACRPFDRLRDGMIAGEGAGFLIVEEHDHARKRGARIYAEIAGYGNTSSAYHIYNPEPSGNGIIRTTMRALRDAELQPEDIDWVCADGISTTESDKAEACALRAVFQDHISSVPVSATKSVTGHMGSGAGAAESVYSVMAINNGIMPPTINYNNPDDDCKLNIVANTPVEKKIDIAVNINQGIGGQSTALIFKKFTG